MVKKEQEDAIILVFAVMPVLSTNNFNVNNMMANVNMNNECAISLKHHTRANEEFHSISLD